MFLEKKNILKLWTFPLIYLHKLLVGSGSILMFETLLVGSAVIKLTLLIWPKNLNKSESKRYFCNYRIQNNKI